MNMWKGCPYVLNVVREHNSKMCNGFETSLLQLKFLLSFFEILFDWLKAIGDVDCSFLLDFFRCL